MFFQNGFRKEYSARCDCQRFSAFFRAKEKSQAFAVRSKGQYFLIGIRLFCKKMLSLQSFS